MQGIAAGEQLSDLLVDLNLSGHLSSKHMCCMDWWAPKAGAVGPVCEFAFKPSSSSGHFHRKVDSVLGFDTKHHQFYNVSTPGHSRRFCSRVTYEIPMRLPHEVIEAEVATLPDVHSAVSSLVAKREVPSS